MLPYHVKVTLYVDRRLYASLEGSSGLENGMDLETLLAIMRNPFTTLMIMLAQPATNVTLLYIYSALNTGFSWISIYALLSIYLAICDFVFVPDVWGGTTGVCKFAAKRWHVSDCVVEARLLSPRPLRSLCPLCSAQRVT